MKIGRVTWSPEYDDRLRKSRCSRCGKWTHRVSYIYKSNACLVCAECFGKHAKGESNQEREPS